MVEVWGQLNKSQTDNQKIDGAIAAAISDHEADADAHLGASESLQSHKAEEVIDHVARSVVRDKIDFDRFTIDEHFASIDGWDISGDVSLDSISMIWIATSAVLNNEAYAVAGLFDALEYQGDFPQYPFWETRVQLLSATNNEVYIIQGYKADPAGVGFKIVNGTVYAFWTDDTPTSYTQVLTGITVTNFNNYSMKVTAGDTLAYKIEFFVNKVLKHTVEIATLAYSGTAVGYYIKNSIASVKAMYAQNFHFDADYI